jgi:hypothetical protein
MAGGALLTAIVLSIPSRWFGVGPESDLPSRLVYAIHADALAVLWLLAAIADVARRPPLLTLFCIGRLTFWLGYRHGAPWRAFGCATTFYPTVYGYALLVWHWIPG